MGFRVRVKTMSTVDGDVGKVAHEALELEDVLLVALLGALEVPGAG